MTKPGEVIGDLPEIRGRGKKYDRPEFAPALAKANANPGQWVLVFRDEKSSIGRSWILRRDPSLQVATRRLEHNTEGRHTIYIRVEE
jgi:hypothetical protein